MIEAMKQALEALFKTLKILADANERGVITDTLWFSEYETLFDYLESEITSLRQVIAEAEKHTLSGRINDARVHAEYDKQRDAARKLIEAEKQEPVAVRQSNGEIYVLGSALVPIVAYLYTHPQPKREWVGLTDEQVEKIIKDNMSLQMNLAGIRQDFEAAHGIKEKKT